MYRTFLLLTGAGLLGASLGCHSATGEHHWHGVCDCAVPPLGAYGLYGANGHNGHDGHGGPVPSGPPPLAGQIAPVPATPVSPYGAPATRPEPIKGMPRETPRTPEKVDEPREDK